MLVVSVQVLTVLYTMCTNLAVLTDAHRLLQNDRLQVYAIVIDGLSSILRSLPVT